MNWDDIDVFKNNILIGSHCHDHNYCIVIRLKTILLTIRNKQKIIEVNMVVAIFFIYQTDYSKTYHMIHIMS